MKAKQLNADLRSAMKRLRLGKILDTLPERIAIAEKDKMPIEDFLLMIFADEIERRNSSATLRRADEAGLDPDMVLERWDKSSKVTYDKRIFNELCSLRFVEARRNVVVLGPVGVGKTFLASALGHAEGSRSASAARTRCSVCSGRVGSTTRARRSWWRSAPSTS